MDAWEYPGSQTINKSFNRLSYDIIYLMSPIPFKKYMYRSKLGYAQFPSSQVSPHPPFHMLNDDGML